MTTVLVVDDEPQIVRTLRINLEARGYGVLTAADGAAALRVAADGKPDVIVLDLGLTGSGRHGGDREPPSVDRRAARGEAFHRVPHLDDVDETESLRRVTGSSCDSRGQVAAGVGVDAESGEGGRAGDHPAGGGPVGRSVGHGGQMGVRGEVGDPGGRLDALGHHL
jgi:CheY-like chemotaxis protein